MVEIIYGRSENSRTDKVVEMISQKKTGRDHIFVVVPDRQSASMEAKIASGGDFGSVDVIDFKRLADYVLRKSGSVCHQHISTASKKVIMNSILTNSAEELLEYGTVSETDLRVTNTFVSARSELYYELISLDELEEASQKLNGKIKNKLHDLSTIFHKYDQKIIEKWRDPDGVLSVVYEKLKESNCFANCVIFVDGFKSFNKQQMRIMEIILTEAKYACISLAFDPLRDKGKPLYNEIEGYAVWLKKILERNHIAANEIFAEQQEGKTSKEIVYLANNYWPKDYSSAKYDEEPQNIRVVKTSDVYREAEFVACDILRRVREGTRWNDIAVIARDADVYKGVVDAVFEKKSIPYFYVGKTDLNGFSLVRFIMSVLDMVEKGINKDNFLSYIKTDYCGIHSEDLYVFENYIRKWNINGRKLQSEFVENPRGMVEFKTEDMELLARLNVIREEIMTPLTGFIGSMRISKTVEERCTVLFHFLKEMDIPAKISSSAERYNELGEFSKELVMNQIWKKVCDSLNTLVVSIGEEPCSFTKYKTYLQAVFAETSIGSIPLRMDEVVVCEAALNNVQGKKHIYVLGAYEGGFPASVGEEGIFTEQEKDELSKVGIDISSRLSFRLSKELYYFYQAVTSGRESVTISYTDSGADGEQREPSSGIRQIDKIFPKLVHQDVRKYEEYDNVWDDDSAFEYCVSHTDNLAQELLTYFGDKPEYVERLKQLNIPMTAANCHIKKETSEALYGKNINLNSTLLDQYAKCRFSYFCNNELRLNDTNPQVFGLVDVGLFVHKLLEETIQYIVRHPDATEEEIDEKIQSSSEDYLKKIIKSEAPNQIKHAVAFLCDSTKRFVNLLKKDMEISKFKPVDFELPIGTAGIKPLMVEINGIKGQVYGTIDRVDSYTDENGNVHVLVYDYKSHDKDFNLKNVEIGLDMQMLLYLYSLKENGEQHFQGEVIPSGISYLCVDPNMKDKREDDDNIGEIKQSGFVCENDLDLANGSSISKLKNIYNEVEMANIEKTVVEQLQNVIVHMSEGNAQASPNPNIKKVCDYCRYKPVCRNAGNVNTEGEN